jgi:hypothetical protein
MEERSVRENAIKALARQIKLVEILQPDLASGVGTCHCSKGGCALQPDSGVAESLEGFEVAARPTPEIENHPRRLAVDMPQERGDILADVVILRAGAEVLSALLVVCERRSSDLVELLGLRPLAMPAALFRLTRARAREVILIQIGAERNKRVLGRMALDPDPGRC